MKVSKNVQCTFCTRNAIRFEGRLPLCARSHMFKVHPNPLLRCGYVKRWKASRKKNKTP